MTSRLYYATAACCLLLLGCPADDTASEAPSTPKAEAAKPLWPLVPGSPYPDLEFKSLEGTPTSLTQLAGRPLLVHLVDVRSPESVGLTGGEFAGSINDVEPRTGALALDELLASEGVDLEGSELMRVHLLLRAGDEAVDLVTAKAWAAHFELVDSDATALMLDDGRYLTAETRKHAPGLHLIHADGRLVSTATPDDSAAMRELLHQAAQLAQGAEVDVPAVAPEGLWPPQKGEPYANLHLTDLEGNPVRLRSLAGKLLLIQLVATQSPGSVGYTGGETIAPFRGMAPDKGSESIDGLLAEKGLPLANDRLQRVHILFFEGMRTHPDLEQAREWDAHFALTSNPNTRVFLADARYATPQTLPMVPGYHLVDRGFLLVSNGTRGNDPLFAHTLTKALSLARERAPVEKLDISGLDLFPADEGSPKPPQVLELLRNHDYDALESFLEAQHKRGRIPQSWEYYIVEDLSTLRRARYEDLAAWTRARPKSYWALIAEGKGFVRAAWESRGSGYANTVTKEGWKGFRKHLVSARRVYQQAAELRPDLPYAYARQIIVDMGQSAPVLTMLKHFKAAQAADPLYIHAYEDALFYLQPRWHGSAQELIQFGTSAVNDYPDEPAMQHVLHEACMYVVSDAVRLGEAETRREYLRANPERLAELKTMVRVVLKAYPHSSESLEDARWLSMVTEKSDGDLWLLAVRGQAEAGYTAGLRRLGQAHMYSWFGVKRDRVEGLRLLLEAARGGDNEAAHDVSVWLRKGKYFPKHPAAARAWAELAVADNHVPSSVQLASMLLKGEGGPSDTQRARRLLKSAAAEGNKEAIKLLDSLGK